MTLRDHPAKQKVPPPSTSGVCAGTLCGAATVTTATGLTWPWPQLVDAARPFWRAQACREERERGKEGYLLVHNLAERKRERDRASCGCLPELLPVNNCSGSTRSPEDPPVRGHTKPFTTIQLSPFCQQGGWGCALSSSQEDCSWLLPQAKQTGDRESALRA